jgi:hypothetical protein
MATEKQGGKAAQPENKVPGPAKSSSAGGSGATRNATKSQGSKGNGAQKLKQKKK